MAITIFRNSWLLYFLIAIAAGCGGKVSQNDNKKSEILDTYFQAFNDHDVESLVGMCTEDIRLISITPDTVTVDLRGKEALQAWLKGYFSSLPDVTSAYADVTIHKPFVSFVETATWGPDSTRKQQSSMATYQIRDGKIHRVWYYYPE